MPLTEKGRKILRSMKQTYGPEKGERVFYASINKGTIKGAERTRGHSYAERTEAFDDAALGEQPPRTSLPRGRPARDSLPRAVGRPAGVRVADGTESPRTTVVTRQAAAPRSPSGARSRTPAGVDRYDDDTV